MDATLQVQAALVRAAIEQARGQTAAAGQRLHALFARLPARAPPHLPLLQRRIEALPARRALAAGDLATPDRRPTTDARQRERMPQVHQAHEACIAAPLP